MGARVRHVMRRFVDTVVEPWGVTGEALDVVRLLSTELVTNAMLHGAPPIRIAVERGRGVVRVDVHDAGHGRPVVRPFDLAAPTGHGILLVDRLAQRWGVDPGDGKSVWFEVPLFTPGHERESVPATTARSSMSRP